MAKFYPVLFFFILFSFSCSKSNDNSDAGNGSQTLDLAPITSWYTWREEVPLTLDAVNVTNVNDINIVINQTISLHPTRISGSQIYFNIPDAVNNQTNTLSVSILGKQSNTVTLTLILPQLPAGGSFVLLPGNTLTINGQYFNPTPANNTVTIGSQTLTVVSAAANQLIVNGNNIKMSDAGYLTITTGTNLNASSSILTGASPETFYVYKFLQPKKLFPGEAREEAVAVTLNGNIYAGLGKSKATGQGLRDWWKYNSATDTWTSQADCPQAAMVANVFTINNHAYIGMGIFDGYTSNTFYCYNPSSNTWSTVAAFPGYATTNSVTFNSAQYGYLVGGYQLTNAGGAEVNAVWKFDPSANQWTQISSFPGMARSNATGFTLNNTGYMAGGQGGNFYPFLMDAWAFSFATETWSQIANLPSGAGSNGQFAFSLNNKGYIGGGVLDVGGGTSPYVYEYDPTLNTWTTKEKILDPINFGGAGVSNGNAAYIIGGWSSGFLYGEGSQSVSQFNP